MMLLPQRPYIPVGTLKGAVVYPAVEGTYPDEAIAEALGRRGCRDLAGRLDEDGFWNARLSRGEQQRLAIARALSGQARLAVPGRGDGGARRADGGGALPRLRERLPETTVVSIGHRSTLLAMHTRRVEMQPGADGVFAPVEVSACGLRGPAKATLLLILRSRPRLGLRLEGRPTVVSGAQAHGGGCGASRQPLRGFLSMRAVGGYAPRPCGLQPALELQHSPPGPAKMRKPSFRPQNTAVRNAMRIVHAGGQAFFVGAIGPTAKRSAGCGMAVAEKVLQPPKPRARNWLSIWTVGRSAGSIAGEADEGPLQVERGISAGPGAPASCWGRLGRLVLAGRERGPAGPAMQAATSATGRRRNNMGSGHSRMRGAGKGRGA